MFQSMSVQQGELFALRMEVQALRERQVQSSRHQAQLEVELQQLREELRQKVPLGQVRECLQVTQSRAAGFQPKQPLSHVTCDHVFIKSAQSSGVFHTCFYRQLSLHASSGNLPNKTTTSA